MSSAFTPRTGSSAVGRSPVRIAEALAWGEADGTVEAIGAVGAATTPVLAAPGCDAAALPLAAVGTGADQSTTAHIEAATEAASPR